MSIKKTTPVSRFVVSTNPQEEALLSQDPEDDEVEAVGYHPTAWDCLRLEFASIPTGLEAVFTESALASYIRLFHLLLTVRRTEHALNAARRGAKRSIDRRIHLLHHQMSFIVNHLNCYLQVTSSRHFLLLTQIQPNLLSLFSHPDRCDCIGL